MTERWQRIVQSGACRLDGPRPTEVHVVCQNWDFWHELAEMECQLQPDEEPELNEDGLAYYVLLGDAPKGEPYFVESEGFLSLAAARAWAESQVPAPIRWDPESG